jgi:ABC-type multidrug transport system fused ATPase/permease subunit
MNGTTKSSVANHVAETFAGAMTIRAFEEEDRFLKKNFNLVDVNASAFFHSFASNEWLIQRVETAYAVVLASAALCLAMLSFGTLTSGETSLFEFSNDHENYMFSSSENSIIFVMQVSYFQARLLQDLSVWLFLMAFR